MHYGHGADECYMICQVMSIEWPMWPIANGIASSLVL